MNYEQKYKEALKRTMNLALTNNISALAAGEIFPELMESEDEEIRKEMINYFKSKYEDPNSLSYDYNKWIAWLEKQGEKKEIDYDEELKKCKDNPLYFFDKYVKIKFKEQGERNPTNGKSYREIFPKFSVGDTLCRQGWSNHTVRKVYVDNITTTYVCENEEGLESHIDISEQDEWNKIEQKSAWSEEDERNIDNIIFELEENEEHISGVAYKIDWLKSLKDRIQPQPKQEWSEEDVVMIEYIIAAIKIGDYYTQDEINKMTSWLKSLKPNHWKPSEFQLECLRKVIPYQNTEKDCELEYALSELYNELRKL